MKKKINSQHLNQAFYMRPFNKVACLEQLKEGSVVVQPNPARTKELVAVITTLEQYDYTKLIALKSYLEDLLVEAEGSLDAHSLQTYKEQYSIINSILTFNKGYFYFIEGESFYRIMHYGYLDKDKLGRLYSFNPSPQRLKREIRYLLFKNDYVDIDLVNAHPCFLLRFAEESKQETPCLRNLVTKRESFYKDLAVELNCDLASVKRTVLKALNQTKEEFYREAQSPSLTALFEEILVIRDLLWTDCLSDDRFNLLQKKPTFLRKSLSKKKVTVQSLFCQTKESEALLDLLHYLESKKDESEEIPLIFIPFFDGAYVSYGSSVQQFMLKRFISEYDPGSEYLKFKLKQFEEEPNLLNLETFQRYIHLTEAFKKMGQIKSQRLSDILGIGLDFQNSPVVDSIVKNARLLSEKNAALKEQLKKAKRKKGGQPDLIKTLLSEIKDTYSYKISADEKKTISKAVNTHLCKIRKVLLQNADTPESLNKFIEKTLGKEEEDLKLPNEIK